MNDNIETTIIRLPEETKSKRQFISTLTTQIENERVAATIMEDRIKLLEIENINLRMAKYAAEILDIKNEIKLAYVQIINGITDLKKIEQRLEELSRRL